MPNAIFCVGEQNRNQMRFIHRPLERRVEGVVVWLFPAEVFFHQSFIQLHDLIEDRRVRRLDGREIALAGLVQQALDDRFARHWRAG